MRGAALPMTTREMRALRMTNEHMKQGSTVVNKLHPARSRVFKLRHASCTALTSAWAARSFSARTDSMPSPMTCPSRTTIEPTGVSPRSHAIWASRMACRMNSMSARVTSSDLVFFHCLIIGFILHPFILLSRDVSGRCGPLRDETHRLTHQQRSHQHYVSLSASNGTNLCGPEGRASELQTLFPWWGRR